MISCPLEVEWVANHTNALEANEPIYQGVAGQLEQIVRRRGKAAMDAHTLVSPRFGHTLLIWIALAPFR